MIFYSTDCTYITVEYGRKVTCNRTIDHWGGGEGGSARKGHESKKESYSQLSVGDFIRTGTNGYARVPVELFK